MNQVSTNLTLFYRLFIPVFFGVFIGALVIFLWLHPQPYYGNLKGDYLRIGLTAFFLIGLVGFYLTGWKLRRVETSKDWVYVTDFFRSARYPWSNIQHISETSLGLFRLVRIHFHEPGSFGSKAVFLASKSRWRIFKQEHPRQITALLK